ncbi:S-layer homology domain-containing protein [Paenibacillus hodogayensis]|uniref:S-layer homology domain-containing protein n=1 Tax=Paenibacillus hodogayensis TaxID=279208 RepID=A0ABV5W7H0_9BACL
MKKAAILTSAAILFGNLAFGTAYAFNDVDAGQAAAVSSLQQKGIVSGIDNERFARKETISYAQSLQMIVKAFDYNLDTMKFAKPPVASGLFAQVRDDAWYADAFVIAYYNNLDIPQDVNPQATVTREQFGSLLMRALEKKANFPMIKIHLPIADEAAITPGNQGAVQRLIHYKIAELDKTGSFLPTAPLSRGEAAVWLYNALDAAASQTRPPVEAEDITLQTEKVNDQVNKVTLSRGAKPNAGYGIQVVGIRFEQDGRAVIRYTLQNPQPDTMYAEVVTEAKAVTYVPAAYKAVLEEVVSN